MVEVQKPDPPSILKAASSRLRSSCDRQALAQERTADNGDEKEAEVTLA